MVNHYNDDDYFEPDDPESEPSKPQGPLSKMPPAKYFRPAIILLILCYIATVLYDKYPLGDKLWASGGTIFKQKEYWRLFTSIFTHADMLHLLSNAFIFLLFGWLLRAYFGLIVFPVISILVGAVTNLITVSVYEPQIKLIGASGMNYGMVALWIIFYLRYDTDNRFAVRILRAAGFCLTLMVPATLSPDTSYFAHVAGFGLGLLAGLLLLPFVKIRVQG